MYELLAVTLGVVIGFALGGVRPAARAIAILVPLGILVGTAVSAAAGEIEISLGFLLFDTTQVTASALLTYVLRRVWQTHGTARGQQCNEQSR